MPAIESSIWRAYARTYIYIVLELPCKDYDKAPFSSAIDFSVETTKKRLSYDKAPFSSAVDFSVETTKKRWSYDKATFSSAIDGVEASANEGWRWDLG